MRLCFGVGKNLYLHAELGRSLLDFAEMKAEQVQLVLTKLWEALSPLYVSAG